MNIIETTAPIDISELKLFFSNKEPKYKYAPIGSKINCHGLVELGFLIFKVFDFDHCLNKSGKILSCDQSPPPITFPALAIPKVIFFFFFKNYLK